MPRESYNRLPPGDYIGLVIPGGVDTFHRGGVRAVILGVTEPFEDEDQPYIYPALGFGIQQVPPPGYYVLVRFIDGNINYGRYYGMSATPSLLPSEYAANYPDVAASNLGEDGFFYTHNRQTHVTTIENPGNSSRMVWDASGFITYESAVAYQNAGMGAKENQGSNTQHVLTEGTIDIFTCMPVGHNRNSTGIGQGSEYLIASHISQATVDAFHGTAPATDTTKNPSVEQTEQDIPKMELFDFEGQVVDRVPIDRTDYCVKRNGAKEIRKIIICHSEGECFPVMAKNFMTTTNNAHYLIGYKAGEPEMLADTSSGLASGVKTALANTGFYQFVDIEEDCGACSGLTVNGEKVNVDSVVIMLIGDAMSQPTQFQLETVDKLVTHIRYKAGDDVPVYKPDNFDLPVSPTKLFPAFPAIE